MDQVNVLVSEVKNARHQLKRARMLVDTTEIALTRFFGSLFDRYTTIVDVVFLPAGTATEVTDEILHERGYYNRSDMFGIITNPLDQDYIELYCENNVHESYNFTMCIPVSIVEQGILSSSNESIDIKQLYEAFAQSARVIYKEHKETQLLLQKQQMFEQLKQELGYLSENNA